MKMRRREFVAGLGTSISLWSLTAHAQRENSVPRIGALLAFDEKDPMAQGWVAALKDQLRKLGWVEGQNIQIDFRWASSDVKAMQQLAEELIALRPDVILSSSTPPTRILMQHTRTIPIVFANLVDPVGSKLVESLAKPGGNVTGFVNLEPSIAGKWLELLKEIAPSIGRVAIPYNPTTAPYAEIYLSNFKSAGAALALQTIAGPVRDLSELETFVAAQGGGPNVGLVPVPDGFMNSMRGNLATLAARYRIPTAHFNRAFVSDGGLISYGNDTNDNYRRAAVYLDRILKGEKPSELAVQFPIKFEFTINLRTAKALGLNVPVTLLARADEVIE
jgi:putative tryptophan/tyrosine transport system substrate-binding protein